MDALGQNSLDKKVEIGLIILNFRIMITFRITLIDGEEILLKLKFFTVAALVLCVVASGSYSFAGNKPENHVIIEAGLAAPYGHLGADFEKTRLGLGASGGLELGFRYRIHLSNTISVAPYFHFVNFGDFNGFEPEVEDYRVASTSLRYGAEFMVMMPGSRNSLRPFLGAGVGMFRNRVTGFVQDFTQVLDRSVNTLGYSMRFGVQFVGLEFSVVYNINRFNTWQFYQSDYRERYNWDNVGFRAGWLIPFGD